MTADRRVLLVSDMDGTLLDHRQTVSVENQRAIERFLGTGGVFGVASGRTFASVTRFSGPLGFRYGILCNGSILYDFERHQTLREHHMPPESRVLAAKLMAEFPYVSVQVYAGLGVYLLRDNELVAAKGIPEEYGGLITPMERVPENWCKMVLTGAPEWMPEVKAYVAEHFPGFHAAMSSRHFMEITGRDVNKGAGLLELCELLGISPERCAAVGDNENDLPMFEVARVSMAVANGRETVQAAADYRLPSNRESAMVAAVEILLREFGMAD